MKAIPTPRVRTRKRSPLAPVAFAVGLAFTSVGVGLAWDRGTSTEKPAHATVQVVGQDPEVLLRLHMADSLRYRTAVTRADVTGADVLGAQALYGRDAVVARVLRYFPVLTAREVAGMGFGKG